LGKKLAGVIEVEQAERTKRPPKHRPGAPRLKDQSKACINRTIYEKGRNP
jgi:hypothetical protein